MTRKALTMALLTAVGVVTPLAAIRPAAHAQAKASHLANPAGDPQALALLKEMAKTYRSLQTYSGTETADGPGMMGMPYTMDLKYARPGRMVCTVTHDDAPTAQVTKSDWVDGKSLYETVSSSPGHYSHKATPEKNRSFWEEALTIRNDVKSPIIMAMLEMNPDITGGGKNSTIEMGAPVTVDGVECETVVMRSSASPAGPTWTTTFAIGRTDHLLRRLTTAVHNPASSRDNYTSTQTFTQVRANPDLPASTFVFAPPAGAVAAEEHPAGAGADPGAVTLLKTMYAAYAALKSYSGGMTISLRGMDGKMSPPLTTATFAYQAPNKAVFYRKSSERTMRAVSDGATLWVTSTQDQTHYMRQPMTGQDWNSRLSLSRFGDNTEYGAESSDWMPALLVNASAMPAEGYDWKLGPHGFVNGEPVATVLLHRGALNEPDNDIVLTLSISLKDHLLRQVTNEYFQKGASQSRQVETYTNIQKNLKFSPDLFTFTPAPGMTPIGDPALFKPVHS